MFLAGLVVSRAVGVATTAMPAATTRPNITRLGTWDLGLVETTPINVKGRLLLYVNSAEQPCSQGAGAGCPPVAERNQRFIDVLTGETVGEAFGHGEGLGCALFDAPSDTVYVYATKCAAAPFVKGETCTVQYYSSSAGTLRGWRQATALDAADGWNHEHNTTLWNTSVDRGEVNGTTMWVMAFETDLSYWTTRFATAPSPAGPWTVLDVDHNYIVDPTLETADPTLRYSAADGFWYCFTGRKAPAAWFFFMEVFRAKEVSGPWEAAPGMGNKSALGTPMLAPTTPAEASADRAVVPEGWQGKERRGFLTALAPWWSDNDDVNNSDLDLVEWENKDPKLGPVGRMVVIFYCWGQQHSNNGLALGIAEGGLAEFMASFW